MRTVVVGIDGSEGGSLALSRAAEEADLRGDELVIVNAWHIPVDTYGFAGVADARYGDIFAGESDKMLVEARDEVRAAHPDLAVRTISAGGPPGSTLTHLALDADVLVVGSRGRGGLGAALLGSVSTYCVHHAHCPVLVVSDRRPSGRRGASHAPVQSAGDGGRP